MFWSANSYVLLLELQNKKSVFTLKTRIPYDLEQTSV